MFAILVHGHLHCAFDKNGIFLTNKELTRKRGVAAGWGIFLTNKKYSWNILDKQRANSEERRGSRLGNGYIMSLAPHSINILDTPHS